MGGSTHGAMLDQHPPCSAAYPVEAPEKGTAAEGASVMPGQPPLLPSQQRARGILLRAAAAASRGTRILRLSICGPASAAADFAVYESLAAFNGVSLGAFFGALQGAPSPAASLQRGNSVAASEALGAPAAAARALRWFVRGSGAFTHIFCPALGTLERRPEARLLLQLLFDRAGNLSAAVASRSKSTAPAARQQQQSRALGGKGALPGPPAHTFILEDVEVLSSNQQRHLARLMDAAGVGWILLCRAPHRLCPELRDRSCCIRFPRPSPSELAAYLHRRATTAATSTAEDAATVAAATPLSGYFVGLARAAGCEPLAALQLALRAASAGFPPLEHLCPDAHVRLQQQPGERGQEGPQAASEADPGVAAPAAVAGGHFGAGASAVSLAGAPLRKLHRILSRRPAGPKTLQALRPVWFEGLCGEHGGLSDQVDLLLLGRAGMLVLLVGQARRAATEAGICAQLLRVRLCAERPEDAAYQDELTSLLATSSVQLREGFLAAGLQPTMDLLNSEILRMRDQRTLDKNGGDSGSNHFTEEAERTEVHIKEAMQPVAARSDPCSLEGVANCREQLGTASSGNPEERPRVPSEETAAVADCLSPQLFGPDE